MKLQKKLRRWLSLYHPRAIRSVVYMLQATEYNVRDYLAWVGRVQNFTRVEKRKQIKYTWKAIALIASAWAIVLFTLFLAAQGFRNIDLIPHLVAIGIVVGVPLIMPRLLLLPLAMLEAVQVPVEFFLVRRAAKKLEKHPGIKIAIAGSFGKTSMREILRTVLREGKRVASPSGSHNTPLAIARFVDTLDGDEEVLVFELGEYYPGDIKRLSRLVMPDIGIITGVNEAHLSKFETIDVAQETIFELEDALHNKPLYVNGENDRAKKRADASAILYSRQGVGTWSVVSPETSLDGTSFVLEQSNERIKVHSKLLGLHQVGPLAASIHVAKHLGLSNEEIERGVSRTSAFDHRLSRRDDEGGVVTLDDSYNGNPDGVNAVIDFLKDIKHHRRWYVTPGLVEMGDSVEIVHNNIGRKLAEVGIEKVVLIKNSVTPYIEAGLKAGSFKGEIIWFDDALKCYASLPSMTVAGDVVLLQNDWPDQYA